MAGHCGVGKRKGGTAGSGKGRLFGKNSKPCFAPAPIRPGIFFGRAWAVGRERVVGVQFFISRCGGVVKASSLVERFGLGLGGDGSFCPGVARDGACGDDARQACRSGSSKRGPDGGDALAASGIGSTDAREGSTDRRRNQCLVEQEIAFWSFGSDRCLSGEYGRVED